MLQTRTNACRLSKIVNKGWVISLLSLWSDETSIKLECHCRHCLRKRSRTKSKAKYPTKSSLFGCYQQVWCNWSVRIWGDSGCNICLYLRIKPCAFYISSRSKWFSRINVAFDWKTAQISLSLLTENRPCAQKHAQVRRFPLAHAVWSTVTAASVNRWHSYRNVPKYSATLI